MNESQVSKSELARKMQCNRSMVTRILNGSHNLTVRTMARALAACHAEVRFQAVPIEWSWGTSNCRTTKPQPAHAGVVMFRRSLSYFLNITLPVWPVSTLLA